MASVMSRWIFFEFFIEPPSCKVHKTLQRKLIEISSSLVIDMKSRCRKFAAFLQLPDFPVVPVLGEDNQQVFTLLIKTFNSLP
jgi:hypothetical protein